MRDDLFIRDLGDGLILRHADSMDGEALADFNGRIHGDNKEDALRVSAWTRDLLTRPHPTFTPSDFTIVEQAASGRIVSSLNIIPQTWTFDGIPFEVGRPELVGTLSEFRSRGLVRAQFDEIHRWCEERGILAQAITGIPNFYRQYGYEMALDMGGRRVGHEANLPKLKDGEAEKYRVRPALDVDLPFVAEVYAETQKRYAISCLRGMDILQYEMNGMSGQNINRFLIQIIEDAQGERVGYLQHPGLPGQIGLSAVGYELWHGLSWLDVSPAVARYLWAKGQEYAQRDGRVCTSFGFMLGQEHPVYAALGESLPGVRSPYAWYLRVPDLTGFIRHIAPALEKRLAESLAVGYSGELKISFYRDGLQMIFTNGKLTEIKQWKPVIGADEGNAAFPGLTFLQLLFGYRSFEELHHAFADCTSKNNEARVLLNSLFPKRLSDVFPVF